MDLAIQEEEQQPFDDPEYVDGHFVLKYVQTFYIPFFIFILIFSVCLPALNESIILELRSS